MSSLSCWLVQTSSRKYHTHTVSKLSFQCLRCCAALGRLQNVWFVFFVCVFRFFVLLRRCLPCPDSHYCWPGSDNPSGKCGAGCDCTGGELRVLPGHWAAPVQQMSSVAKQQISFEKSNETTTAAPCQYWQACPGGKVSLATEAEMVLCRNGYTGVGCSACSAGYIKIGQRCHACLRFAVSYIAIIVIITAMLCCVAFVTTLVLDERTKVREVSIVTYIELVQNHRSICCELCPF